MQMSDKTWMIIAASAVIALKSWDIWNKNLAIGKVTQIWDYHFLVAAKVTIVALHAV
jgi:hypothetical protein